MRDMRVGFRSQVPGGSDYLIGSVCAEWPCASKFQPGREIIAFIVSVFVLS